VERKDKINMTQTLTRGVTAISEAFKRASSEGRPTFMPFWMLGYPDLPTSMEVIQMLIEEGADMIELEVPFSDPLADGVVIQAAAQASLDSGTTLTDCIRVVRELRAGGATTPFLMMGYLNPFMSYGLDKFTQDAAAAGVDGFIVPDLPPDEAQDMMRYTQAHDLALIELLAPTSSPERIKLIAETARGFIYLVSVTGVTGARSELPPGLPEYIERVRAATDTPLAVGFGVSTPEQAATIGKFADGVIVGSALIREFNKNGIEGLRALVQVLRNVE
jgi:tryptophan synthase alpha chain